MDMGMIEGIVVGEVKFTFPKLLRSLGLADTPENRIVAVKAMAEFLRRKFPHVPQDVTCPDCKGRGCLYLFGPPVTCPRCQGRRTLPIFIPPPDVTVGGSP